MTKTIPENSNTSPSTSVLTTPNRNTNESQSTASSKSARRRQRKRIKREEERGLPQYVLKKEDKTEDTDVKTLKGGLVVEEKGNFSPKRTKNMMNVNTDDDGEIVSTTSSEKSNAEEYLCTLCQKCVEPAAATKTIGNLQSIKDEGNNEFHKDINDLSEEEKMKKMTDACETILSCIGEDPSREGLLRTPHRWAKALLYMTHGYEKELSTVLNGAVFSEDHREMVIVRDIDIHSLCEHHMVPFTGRVHVGYIPNGKILGLSKIARVAEIFARRLQVQERLTRQIADAIVDAVNPLGVAVMIECSHFCMVMRGVQKVGSSTVTSCVRGCFETDAKTRAEFFSIINR